MTPNPPNNTNFCIFRYFHIVVVGQRRDFKFGTQLNRSKSQQYGLHAVPERGVVKSHDPFLICHISGMAEARAV